MSYENNVDIEGCKWNSVESKESIIDKMCGRSESDNDMENTRIKTKTKSED